MYRKLVVAREVAILHNVCPGIKLRPVTVNIVVDLRPALEGDTLANDGR